MPLGAALAIGGASLLGGMISSNAASDAASTQAAAADRASQNQLKMYQQGMQNMLPWMQSGQTANVALMQLMGLPVNTPEIAGSGPLSLNPSNTPPTSTTSAPISGSQGWVEPGSIMDIVNKHMPGFNRAASTAVTTAPATTTPMINPGTGGVVGGPAPNLIGSNAGIGMKPFSPDQFWMDPSYQFQLDEMQKNLTNWSSKNGGPMAGNTLLALLDRTHNLASTGYQQAYQNYNNYVGTLFDRLNAISGTGANTAGGVAHLGADTAGQIGQNITGAGNAMAAGQVGSANALSGALQGVGNAAMYYGANNNPGGTGMSYSAFVPQGGGFGSNLSMPAAWSNDALGFNP